MKTLRIILFIIAAIATATVLFFLVSYYIDKNENNKETALRINALVNQKAEIESENSYLKSELSDCSTLGAAVFFLFTEYNDYLKEEVAVKLYESGDMSGIICSSPEDSDSDDIRFLTEGFSWELASRINEKIAEDGIEEYLERYEKTPEIVYFETGVYDSKYDSMLVEKGVKALVIQGYTPSGNYYTEGNGLIKALYLPFTNAHTIESLLTEALENKFPVAITIKSVTSDYLSQDKDTISTSSFDKMLAYVSKYSSAVHLCDCGEYADKTIEQLENGRAHYDEINSKIEENIFDIDKINKQISELSKG